MSAKRNSKLLEQLYGDKAAAIEQGKRDDKRLKEIQDRIARKVGVPPMKEPLHHVPFEGFPTGPKKDKP